MMISRTCTTLLTCLLLLSCHNNSSDVPLGLSQRPDNQTCIAPENPGNIAASILLEKAFPDLADMGEIVALVQPNTDTSSWYAVIKNGVVKQFNNLAGVTQATDFMDISSQITGGGEMGLLGMAFHPDYATNDEVYLYYTRTDANQLRSYISRFTFNQNSWLEQPLLVINQPYSNHNGGNIAFGPDGYLYIGLGDGGSGNDPDGNGQQPRTLLGSMLRIDVNQGTPYGIPAENPFAGNALCSNPDVVMNAANCPEIYAYGLRNPWRWSFDKTTGTLWAGDVGQGTREEVDIIKAGNNYGWNIMEGFICRPGGGTCDPAGLTLPEFDYEHIQGNQSIVGGYVYRGSNTDLTILNDTYIYADTYSGRIWGLKGTTGNYVNNELFDFNANIYSFAQDAQGELYVLSPTFSTGGSGNNIYKIVADPSSVIPGQIPANLSATGCVDPNDPTKPTEGLIPYDVISPLWSDDADKTRYMAIPNTATIDVAANGDFIFPIGTVLVKNFSLNGRIVETRLLMRHNNTIGWSGYSYEWQYDQQDQPTDAILLTTPKTKFIENQNWYYPSPGECFTCHVVASNYALGPEFLQLNHSMIYPGSNVNANQITTLVAIGVLTSNPQESLKSQSLYTLNDNTATYEQKAKSYLHSNCAHCHQPGVTPLVTMDLRYLTPLQNMNICGVTPLRGDLNQTNPLLIDANGSFTDPNSILILRMASEAISGVRMPPFASEIVHNEAVDVLKLWVDQLNACP